MKTLLIACFAGLCAVHADPGPEAGKQVAQALEVKDEKGGKEKLRYWLALPPAEEKKPEAG